MTATWMSFAPAYNRVGCYPCIYASKEEVALIAQHEPAVIDEIRELEAEMLALRRARNEERPGRYKYADDASFFQTRRQGFTGIDAVVAWARTDHGGRQYPLLAEPPRGGCMRWGICDLPAGPPAAPVAAPFDGEPGAGDLVQWWVCADCGYEQLDDVPCKVCKSSRVAAVEVIERLMGANWRDAFKPEGPA